MPITIERTFENLSIGPLKELTVHYLVQITPDGDEGYSYSERKTFWPGDDLQAQDEVVQKTGAALWTQEVIQASQVQEAQMVEAFTVNKSGEITVSTSRKIYDRGVEVGHRPEQIIVKPGDDLKALDNQEVKVLAETVHTAELVAKYQADEAVKQG
jgi:hypothetical protein